MQNFRVFQGSKLTITVTLKDGMGTKITMYDGTQNLVATVWQGEDGPPLFSPATAWLTVLPAVNTIGISITGEQTAAVSPATYVLVAKLDDGGEWVDAYVCTVTILPFAGGTP